MTLHFLFPQSPQFSQGNHTLDRPSSIHEDSPHTQAKFSLKRQYLRIQYFHLGQYLSERTERILNNKGHFQYFQSLFIVYCLFAKKKLYK